MILDADDRLKIKQGKITLAVYHEEKEKWYGFIDGKLVQVDWFNIKSLATAFGVKY
jgi:sporulation protein YlmC with PRC-barrel domain